MREPQRHQRPGLDQLRRLPRQAMRRAPPLLRQSKLQSFLFFFARRMLIWQLALFFRQFCQAGVVASFDVPSFLHVPLLTTALLFRRIRRKAQKITAVYGLGESSLLQECAVRGAHRSVQVVVHDACLCCWLCPFCCCLDRSFSTVVPFFS